MTAAAPGGTALPEPARIAEVRTRAEAAAFDRLPLALGGEAAGWAVPLALEAGIVFSPRRNPSLGEWHLARFVAWRGGRAVGRIVAAMPRAGGTAAAMPRAGGIGNFGFLALERDAALLRALLEAAAAWLVARGATRIRGPLNYSINHEAGARVDGAGAMLRMPRNPAWLPPMLDEVAPDRGLAREKDVLACTLTVAQERHRARFAPLLARWAGRRDLALRPLRLSRLAAEVDLVRDIFNDAWAENWGAMPVSPAEAATMRGLLAPLLVTGRVFFAEWKGEPIGLVSVVPNIDPAVAASGGRLLPLGWARLGAALLGGGTEARVPMLGIRRAWRGSTVSAMATGALLSAAIGLAERRGWARLEVSWILEDNAPMLHLMEGLPAPVSGRWRIWGGPVGAWGEAGP